MSTAVEQLRRLLAFLPRLADDKPHRIADVAAELHMNADDIVKDLFAMTQRAHEPPGWIDPVSVYMEGDVIELLAPGHFRRPMRLTAAECEALALGLSLLRAERSPDDRPAVDRTLDKLREVVVPPAGDDAKAVIPRSEATRDLHFRAASLTPERNLKHVPVLRDAIREHHRVALQYQKAGATAPERRVVCPCGFVAEQGMLYLVANCADAEGIRVFRMDRIMGVEALGETFQPTDVDMDTMFASGKAFSGETTETLTVRFSPRVARWIAEREQGSKQRDGSFDVQYPLADDEWAVRHVLRYGPEAEVLAPPRVRELVVKRLKVMLA